MTHTPGPWKNCQLVIKTTQGIIAECPVPQKGGTFECQANARLIAAAPELLEVLRNLVVACTTSPMTADEVSGKTIPRGVRIPEKAIVSMARAAIAKEERKP